MFPAFSFTSYESRRIRSSSSDSQTVSRRTNSDESGESRTHSVPRDFRINTSWDGLLDMFRLFYTSLPISLEVENSNAIMKDLRRQMVEAPRYVIAPDGYIPNSLLRSRLKPSGPEKTLESRISRQDSSRLTNLEMLVNRYLSDARSRGSLPSLDSLRQATLIKLPKPLPPSRLSGQLDDSAIGQRLAPPTIDLATAMNVDVELMLEQPDCNQLELDPSTVSTSSTEARGRLFGSGKNKEDEDDDTDQQIEGGSSKGKPMSPAQYQRMARELTREKVQAHFDKIIKSSKDKRQANRNLDSEESEDEVIGEGKVDGQSGAEESASKTRRRPPPKIRSGGSRMIARESSAEMLRKGSAVDSSEQELSYNLVKKLLNKLTEQMGNRTRVMTHMNGAVNKRPSAIETLDSALKSKDNRIGLVNSITSLDWAFDYLSNYLGSANVLMDQLNVLLKPDRGGVGIDVKTGLKAQHLGYFCNKEKMELFHEKFKECWIMFEQQLVRVGGMNVTTARTMAMEVIAGSEEARQMLNEWLPVANLDGLIEAIRRCRPDDVQLLMNEAAATEASTDLLSEDTTGAQVFTSSDMRDDMLTHRKYSEKDGKPDEAVHRASKTQRRSKAPPERMSALAKDLPLLKGAVESTPEVSDSVETSASRDVRASGAGSAHAGRAFPDSDEQVGKAMTRKHPPARSGKSASPLNKQKFATMKPKKQAKKPIGGFAKIGADEAMVVVRKRRIDSQEGDEGEEEAEELGSLAAALQDQDDARTKKKRSSSKRSDSFTLSNLISLNEYESDWKHMKTIRRARKGADDHDKESSMAADVSSDLGGGLSRFEAGQVKRYESDPDNIENLISIEKLPASTDRLADFLQKLKMNSWFKTESDPQDRNDYAVAIFLLLPFLHNKTEMRQAETALIQLIKQYKLVDNCTEYIQGQSKKIFDKCLENIRASKPRLKLKKEAFVRAVSQISILSNLDFEVESMIQELMDAFLKTLESEGIIDAKKSDEVRQRKLGLRGQKGKSRRKMATSDSARLRAGKRAVAAGGRLSDQFDDMFSSDDDTDRSDYQEGGFDDEDDGGRRLKTSPSLRRRGAGRRTPESDRGGLRSADSDLSGQQGAVAMIKEFLSSHTDETSENGVPLPSLSLKLLADALKDPSMAEEAGKLFDFIEKELGLSNAEPDEILERLRIQLEYGGHAGKSMPFNKMINLMSVLMTLEDSGMLEPDDGGESDGQWAERVKKERANIFQALCDDVEDQLNYEQKVLEDLTPVQRLIWPTIETQADIARECCEKIAFLVSNNAVCPKLASTVVSFGMIDLIDSITILSYAKENEEGEASEEEKAGQRRVYQQAMDLVEVLDWFNVRPKSIIAALQNFKELGEHSPLLDSKTRGELQVTATGIVAPETYREFIDLSQLDTGTIVEYDESCPIKRRPLGSYSRETLLEPPEGQTREQMAQWMKDQLVVKRMTNRLSQIKHQLSDVARRRRPDSKLAQIGSRILEGLRLITQSEESGRTKDSHSDDDSDNIEAFETPKVSVFNRRAMSRLKPGSKMGTSAGARESRRSTLKLYSLYDGWEKSSTSRRSLTLGTTDTSQMMLLPNRMLKQVGGALSLVPTKINRDVCRDPREKPRPLAMAFSPIRNEVVPKPVGEKSTDKDTLDGRTRQRKKGIELVKFDDDDQGTLPIKVYPAKPAKYVEKFRRPSNRQGAWAWLDAILDVDPSIVVRSLNKMSTSAVKKRGLVDRRNSSGSNDAKSMVESVLTTTKSLSLFPMIPKRKTSANRFRLIGKSFYQRKREKQSLPDIGTKHSMLPPIEETGYSKIVGSLDDAVRYLRFHLQPGQFSRLLEELELYPKEDHVEILEQALEEAAIVSKTNRPLRRQAPQRPAKINPNVWHQLGMAERKTTLLDRLHDNLNGGNQQQPPPRPPIDWNKRPTGSHCRYDDLVRRGLHRHGVSIGAYLQRKDLVDGIVRGCQERESIVLLNST